MKEKVIHLRDGKWKIFHPFFGISVCGKHSGLNINEDLEKVTCKNCKRTKIYKEKIISELKVYGGYVIRKGKQVRAIIATTYKLTNDWCETKDAIEIKIALTKPTRIFVASSSGSKDFKELKIDI